MTSWQAIRLVTAREMGERARSGAFILSVVLVLLFLAGGLLLPLIFAGDDDVHYELGVVGEGAGAILDAALAMANHEGADSTTTVEVIPFPSRAAAEAAVDDGEVDGVLVGGSELVVSGEDGDSASGLERLLQGGARSHQIESLVASGEGEVVRILTSAPLSVTPLSGAAPEENAGRSIVAFGGVMLMYMAVLLYGSMTLTGVTEEKTNRVVEVLLAAFEPWQLLAGKIVGIGLLGLAQFMGTVVIALVGIELIGGFDLPELPIDIVVSLLVWFVLGYSFFAVLFGATGALVSRPEDAQNVAAPITLVAVAGFFVAVQALNDPTSTLSVIATFVPPVAPFVAPVRFALGAMPWWQMAASVTVMALTIAVTIRLAGRVYMGGLLRFGAKVSIREAFRRAEL